MKDILIFKPEHDKKADKIIKKLNIDKFSRKIICIAGCSGCGKSEVASRIQSKLENKGIYVKIIKQDAYYKLPPKERAIKRTEPGVIGKGELDWGTIENSILNLYYSRAYNLIIFEGLYALYLSNFDYGIYIDKTDEECYDFKVKRGKENEDDPFRKYILTKERVCIEKSKRKANIIL